MTTRCYVRSCTRNSTNFICTGGKRGSGYHTQAASTFSNATSPDFLSVSLLFCLQTFSVLLHLAPSSRGLTATLAVVNDVAAACRRENERRWQAFSYWSPQRRSASDRSSTTADLPTTVNGESIISSSVDTRLSPTRRDATGRDATVIKPLISTYRSAATPTAYTVRASLRV